MKLKEYLGVIVVLAAMILVGVCVFLFEGNPNGLEILSREGGNFWVGPIMFALVLGGATYFIKRKIDKEGTLGGNTLIPVLIAVSVFAGIAFGKGCTDKANGGVTTEKGRKNAPKPDSTRISADSLIKLGSK